MNIYSKASNSIRNWKIGTKILIAFTGVAIVAVGLVGFFAFSTGSSILEAESFNKLTAVREMKASQVEDYFETIEKQIITLSEDRMIIEAMRRFDGGLHFINQDLDLSDEDIEAVDARLRTYYEEEFLPRLIPNLLEDVTVEDYWPEDENTRILQDLYISSNPFATGSKYFLDDPGDGSGYSQTHSLFHPIIRDFQQQFGYYDIFLVDVEAGGHIAYSVFKEVDYATSLLDGPYSDTNFAEAYLAARDADEKDFVKIVDFSPYDPSYHAPASFIASPIFDEDEKIGVLVFQMPIDRINDVMTNNQNWAAVGLGQSGETYIVGDDFTLRNQSRYLIEDSENYFKLIDEIGTPLSTIARIRNLNSTIGLQEVKTAGTLAAQDGAKGTDVFPDYRGVPVLSSYKPLDIQDMDRVLMSEIDQAEAFAAIRSLGINIGMAVAGLIAVIVVLAVLFSRTITRPLDQLTQTAHELADGNLNVDVLFTEQEDEIGVLASSFDVMRISMKDLIGELEDINRNLEQRVAERTEELEQANERVRAVIDSAPDAIITIDLEQNIVMFNPSAEKTFGYKMDEVIGQPLTKLMPSSATEIHPNHVKDFQNSDSAIAYMENRSGIDGMRKDSTTFPAEASIAKMMLGDQQFFTAILRDVTERKKAEAQLHLQSSALNSAANGIVITDSEGSIEWVNPAFSELTGYSLEEIIGQNPNSLKSGEHDQSFYKNMWDTINSGQVWQGELINKHKDGSLYPEEMTITPVYDDGGKIINFVAIKQDITERREAEAQLRVLSGALSSAANGIAITDPEDKVEWVNPSLVELTGYASDEILGQQITILSSEEHPDDFYADITKQIRSGKVWQGEMIKQKKDGSLYPEDLSITPIIDGEGKIVNYVSISQDITERKELERQLKIANERMSIELNFAREIQMSMLPLIFPAFPLRKEVTLHATLHPAREVGGDFYDFYFLDDWNGCFVPFEHKKDPLFLALLGILWVGC